MFSQGVEKHVEQLLDLDTCGPSVIGRSQIETSHLGYETMKITFCYLIINAWLDR